jgi:hypothetical protein
MLQCYFHRWHLRFIIYFLNPENIIFNTKTFILKGFNKSEVLKCQLLKVLTFQKG